MSRGGGDYSYLGMQSPLDNDAGNQDSRNYHPPPRFGCLSTIIFVGVVALGGFYQCNQRLPFQQPATRPAVTQPAFDPVKMHEEFQEEFDRELKQRQKIERERRGFNNKEMLDREARR